MMMNWLDWYNALDKPSWTPTPSTISLIWMILYPVILVSFGFVFVQTFRRRIGWKVALPFAANLVANLLFMPIFSGLRNVPLAAVLPLGRSGPGSIFRVGVHRHGDPGVDRCDELGEAMMRLDICCLFRTVNGFTSIRPYPLPPILFDGCFHCFSLLRDLQ